MMYQSLQGMRVVEGASFIAAPIAGLYLRQLGAEVIRFDQIGGGPDFKRWPRAKNGRSFLWENLNRGKKSIALDLKKPEGREIAISLIASAGSEAGHFLTNYPADGFLAHDALAHRRADLVTVRVMGWPDGRSAVDYTINPMTGVPFMTGPVNSAEPVNNVIPIWDLLTGSFAAMSLLTASQDRQRHGKGREIRIPLSDVAISTLSNLGMLGEISQRGTARPRYGNDLYGAFGRDFVSRDGRKLMVVAITARQWEGLVQALSLKEAVTDVERREGVSFAVDEGQRFLHRETLNGLVGGTIGQLPFADLEQRFNSHDVCWEPYRDLKQAISELPALVSNNPIFSEVSHGSAMRYPAPGYAGSAVGELRLAETAAPLLGADTEQILSEVLGLPSSEIARLHDRGVVASSAKNDPI